MTMIIARRIPSQLAGAESCGPNQQWDPNYVMPGLPPGQCTPKGSPMTPGPSGGFFDSFLQSMFPRPVTPMVPGGVMPMMPQQGMSQNTMIALGLGAVGILAIAMMASRR